jgi:hypothetical protein
MENMNKKKKEQKNTRGPFLKNVMKEPEQQKQKEETKQFGILKSSIKCSCQETKFFF